MIQESLVDHALNRLLEHFGSRVILRPPATLAELASLESLAGPLPRDFVTFLLTCNGLRVPLEGDGEEHLWGLSEIMSALCHADGPSPPAGMIPFRGLPADTRDWLVNEPGPMHGTIVRWDPWGRGEELVGSSFGQYFDNWCRYLIETFDVMGRPPRHGIVQFDAAYAMQHDAALSRLRKRPEVERALHALETQTCGGDDFE